MCYESTPTFSVSPHTHGNLATGSGSLQFLHYRADTKKKKRKEKEIHAWSFILYVRYTYNKDLSGIYIYF